MNFLDVFGFIDFMNSIYFLDFLALFYWFPWVHWFHWFHWFPWFHWFISLISWISSISSISWVPLMFLISLIDFIDFLGFIDFITQYVPLSWFHDLTGSKPLFSKIWISRVIGSAENDRTGGSPGSWWLQKWRGTWTTIRGILAFHEPFGHSKNLLGCPHWIVVLTG